MIYKEDVSEKDNLKVDNKTGLNIKFLIRLLKIIYFIFIKNFNCFIWLNLLFIIIVGICCGILNPFINNIAYMLITPCLDKNYSFFILIGLIAATVISFSILDSFRLYLNQLYGISIRNLFTKYIHDNYFINKVYYKMIKLDKNIDNPDQRIVSDVYEKIFFFLNLNFFFLEIIYFQEFLNQVE
jgi:ABC-type uncharacterized transport system fused permease/ATPase subunit